MTSKYLYILSIKIASIIFQKSIKYYLIISKHCEIYSTLHLSYYFCFLTKFDYLQKYIFRVAFIFLCFSVLVFYFNSSFFLFYLFHVFSLIKFPSSFGSSLSTYPTSFQFIVFIYFSESFENIFFFIWISLVSVQHHNLPIRW